MTTRVQVQADDFDVASTLAELEDDRAGAIASFIGTVRGGGLPPLRSLTLDYYPAMTEPIVRALSEGVASRFGLMHCRVIHRVGCLFPGDRIVLVAASATHRAPALAAVAALIDRLKTDAPFWKREEYADGTARWLEPTEADITAAATWSAREPIPA